MSHPEIARFVEARLSEDGSWANNYRFPKVLNENMSPDSVGVPPSSAEYWEEVARLRAGQVGALMSGNTPLFAGLAIKLEKLEKHEESFKSAGPSQSQRQQLRDALEALVRIVDQILEQ